MNDSRKFNLNRDDLASIATNTIIAALAILVPYMMQITQDPVNTVFNWQYAFTVLVFAFMKTIQKYLAGE